MHERVSPCRLKTRSAAYNCDRALLTVLTKQNYKNNKEKH
jgi:hypothetical protein